MQTVEITISGGAVQSVASPAGIRVVIRDYDVESADAGDGFDIRTDAGGDPYQHMEFVRKANRSAKSRAATHQQERKPKRRS